MRPVALWAAAGVVDRARPVVAGAVAAEPAVLAGHLVGRVSEVVSVADLLGPPSEPRGQVAGAAERAPHTGLGVHQAEVERLGAPRHVVCSLCSAHRFRSVAFRCLCAVA